MAEFIRCTELYGLNENVLLNIDAVKIVRRHEKAEREDILEDYDGNCYAVALDDLGLCKIPDSFILDLLER